MSYERVVVFDVESTTFQKGAPYAQRNKLCSVACVSGAWGNVYRIEHGSEPFGHRLGEVRKLLESASLVVGFNLKFDIAWIRRYIPDIKIKRVWDCQLAEFILSGQKNVLPSLNATLESYGISKKLDVVAELWAKGYDTDMIPWEILAEYNLDDVLKTQEVYHKQVQRLTGNQLKLFQVQCADLLVLQEMEHNGMCFDTDKANELDVICQQKIEELTEELNALVGTDKVNWDSPEQCSIALYGGVLNWPTRVSKFVTLKNGTVKESLVNGYEYIKFDGFFRPIPATEGSKTKGISDVELRTSNVQSTNGNRGKYLSRIYSTDQPTLQTVGRRIRSKRGSRILQILATLADQRKLSSTYYRGIPATCEEMDWPKGIIHGQFNQCIAITGRLSSSKPNLQNFAGMIKPLFKTRF